MIDLQDKIKMVDDLIKENPNATVGDYIRELRETNEEIRAILAADLP